MLKRLRDILVRSFVGALALGWVFAQAIMHFSYMIAAPMTQWLARREYNRLTLRADISTRFSVLDAVPELLQSLVLFVVGYILLRWLYFRPLADPATSPPLEPTR